MKKKKTKPIKKTTFS